MPRMSKEEAANAAKVLDTIGNVAAVIALFSFCVLVFTLILLIWSIGSEDSVLPVVKVTLTALLSIILSIVTFYACFLFAEVLRKD